MSIIEEIEEIEDIKNRIEELIREATKPLVDQITEHLAGIPGMPPDFLAAAMTYPRAFNAIYDAVRHSEVPQTQWWSLALLPLETWTKIYDGIANNPDLLAELQRMNAGVATEEEKRSAYAKVNDLFIKIGEDELVLAGIVIGVGIAAALAAIPTGGTTLGVAIVTIAIGVLILEVGAATLILATIANICKGE
jgi:hypothetical protein